MIEQILYNQIPVKNIPNAVKWYTEVLSFEFIWHSEEEKMAQLNLPSGQILFLLETDEQANINFTQHGVKHGVTGFHTKEIEKLYRQLRARNVKVTEITDDGENQFLDFFDPDGNMFNVQCDVPRKRRMKMTVSQKNEANLTEKKAFHAVGLEWEGTFAEAGTGGIRAVHRALQERLKENPHVINPETMLGLSYHAVPGGERFTHYAVVEVEKVEKVPARMVTVSIPTLTYATCKHDKNQRIDQSYHNIYHWIKSQGYKENNVDNLTHFEQYPMSQDPYADDPEFVIMIPIVSQGIK